MTHSIVVDGLAGQTFFHQKFCLESKKMLKMDWFIPGSKSARLVLMFAAFFAFASVGCGNEPETDNANGDHAHDGDGTGDETGDGTGDGTGDADVRVELTITMNEFASAAALADLTVTIGSESGTTDSDGRVVLAVAPDADLEMMVTGDAIRDHYIYFRSGAEDHARGWGLASNDTVAFLGSQIPGVTVDSEKGILSVIPRTPAGNAIPNMKISVDATADLQLVTDSESQIGLSPGDTTLRNSSSTSIFVNITPGDVTPTFSHAWGHTCDIGPVPITIPAGSYVIAHYECDYTPIEVTMNFLEAGARTPLVGLTTRFSGVDYVTDAEGSFTMSVPPNAGGRMLLEGNDIRNHTLHFRIPGESGDLFFPLTSETTLAGMATMLGVTLDADEGIIGINIRDLETKGILPDVTISLDATAEMQAVLNASNLPVEGSTTLADAASNSYFINVPPGEVVPSFAHDDGINCPLGPGFPVEAEAGVFTIAYYYCELD